MTYSNPNFCNIVVYTLHILLVSAYFVPLTNGLKCFNSCFENCNSELCSGKCGPFFSKLGRNLPGYIQVECSDDDLCIYVEVLAQRGFGGNFALTAPAGCLLDFRKRVRNISLLFFAQNVSLFACDGELCNKPPLATCNAAAVEIHSGNGTDDRCLIKEEIISKLFRNFVRGGNEATDKRGFCLRDGFREFSPDSNCFTEITATSSPTCKNLTDLDEIPVLKCENCTFPECDVNKVTPGPTSFPTFSPIIAPTISPSNNPTFSTTKEPSERFSDASTTSPNYIGIPTVSPEIKDNSRNDASSDENLFLIIIIALAGLFLVVAVVLVLVLRLTRTTAKIAKIPTVEISEANVSINGNGRGIVTTSSVEALAESAVNDAIKVVNSSSRQAVESNESSDNFSLFQEIETF